MTTNAPLPQTEDEIVAVTDASDRANLAVGDLAIADVSSKYLSKTNITAVIIAIFGVLSALKVLPPAVADPAVAGSLVAAGAVLVAYFRTVAKTILK